MYVKRKRAGMYTRISVASTVDLMNALLSGVSIPLELNRENQVGLIQVPLGSNDTHQHDEVRVD